MPKSKSLEIKLYPVLQDIATVSEKLQSLIARYQAENRTPQELAETLSIFAPLPSYNLHKRLGELEKFTVPNSSDRTRKASNQYQRLTFLVELTQTIAFSEYYTGKHTTAFARMMTAIDYANEALTFLNNNEDLHVLLGDEFTEQQAFIDQDLIPLFCELDTWLTPYYDGIMDAEEPQIDYPEEQKNNISVVLLYTEKAIDFLKKNLPTSEFCATFMATRADALRARAMFTIVDPTKKSAAIADLREAEKLYKNLVCDDARHNQKICHDTLQLHCPEEKLLSLEEAPIPTQKKRPRKDDGASSSSFLFPTVSGNSEFSKPSKLILSTELVSPILTSPQGASTTIISPLKNDQSNPKSYNPLLGPPKKRICSALRQKQQDSETPATKMANDVPAPPTPAR